MAEARRGAFRAGKAPMIRYAWRWFRSLVFAGQMYAAMALLAMVFTPLALVHRRYAFAGVRTYRRYVRWSARAMLGLRSEIRGAVPRGEVMVAAKHQSFFDIILICSVLDRPKFIMKAQLRRAPILGWYAHRMGCIPVDRGKRGQAIAAMKAAVEAGRMRPGQLVIYPQGTRVAPGVAMPYKIGTAALYEQLGQGCVPAATNVGVFWPRRGVYRRPGLAVVAFLAPIEAGRPLKGFMAELEATVEGASESLRAEAVGRAAPAPSPARRGGAA